MATTEAPPVTPADAYLAVLLDENITVLGAQQAAFAAGVAADKFHDDRRLALQRLDASRAVAAAAEVRARAVELRQEEKALLAVEEEAIATVTAELEEEFRRRLAEATEAAQQPLRQFKAETAAEQAKLDKISKAGSDGERLLRQTADKKIDEAVGRLENAELDVWGGLAPATANDVPFEQRFSAIGRANQRYQQIERLRELKLRPEYFEHAASNPWRTIEAPADVASGHPSN